MRILVVSQYFWPENFRVNDLCSELSKRGHEVTVLTGIPNYPSGKIEPEYKKNPGNYSSFEGCKIIRVPIILRGDNSISLMFNYLSYPLVGATFGLFKLRKQKFDVVFVFQLSPIMLAIPALVYKALYKTPVVMWVLDLWPDTLKSVAANVGGLPYKLVSWLVKRIYNRCDLILGQSQSFVARIKNSCRENTKVEFMPNWSEDIFNQPIDNLQSKVGTYFDNNSFNILFAGNVGEAQDFTSIIESALIIKKLGANIRIYIVGDGRESMYVKRQITKNELENTMIMLGRFPLEEMPAFYNASNALLVSLKKSEAFSMTIPGKLQSYMSAGKPILTMLDGEGSNVVNEANCGFTNSSGDYDGLAESMIKMSKLSELELSTLGKNSLDYSTLHFSREKIIDVLETKLNMYVKHNNSK